MAISLVLLTMICGFLVFQDYQRNLTQLLETKFKPQQTHLRELDHIISTSHKLLNQGSDIIAQHLLVYPRYEHVNNNIEFAVADRAKQVYQLDLLQPNRIMGVAQGTHRPVVQLLLNHYDVIEPVLTSMIGNEFVAGVAFVNMGQNTLFTYSKAGEFSSPGKIFNWMQHNKGLLDASYTRRTLVFAPPIYDSIKEQNLNYVLYPVATNLKNKQFIVVKLESRLVSRAEKRNEKMRFVSWHQKSGLAIESNVASEHTESENRRQFLVTRYLPSQFHDYVRAPKPSILFEPDLNIVETRLQSDPSVKEWLVYFQSLPPTPYRFLYFTPAAPLMHESLQQALTENLPIFLSGLGVILLSFSVVIWQLAVPTSKLITHIEQQSSLYEMDSQIVVAGWEKWFEKVSLSFSDNRKLLRSLMEKNKQLDSKVQQRTRELQTQTKSKDRNLALNRAIMNSIPDMIYYKNIDGSYLGCNSAFEYFAGTSEAELVTFLTEDIFSERDAEELTKFDFQALKSKRIFTGKCWHRFPDGRDLNIHWLVSPIINLEGEVLGLLGLGKDITEQEQSIKKIEQARLEAEQANEAKSQFIANMSHEIRTPMNAIMGMLELMHSASPSALQQSYLNVAETSSQHLLHIINDILDFSKVNADKLELHNDVFGLSEVFDIAFANSLPAAMEKGLLLDIHMPLELPEYFVGDQVRLNQVFTNLIGNAVKFTESGSVTLAVHVVNRLEDVYQLEFVLTDTGVGIPDDKQKRVFDAFTQADSTVTREYGGTGLGLTIVYQLVRLMGGTTQLKSDVGKGTQFTICLTLEATTEQPDYARVKREWVIYEPTYTCRKILLDKLRLAGQNFRVYEQNEVQELELHQNEILICQPDLLTLMPQRELDKINLGQAHFQPVVFDLSHFSSDFIHGLPYYPILSIPFSVKSLLFNQFQHQVVERLDGSCHQQQLTGIRILVVEDNDINQQVLRLILEEEGAIVSVADNGESGLKAVKTGEFDIVIIDVQMPVMDGLTCASRIREIEEFAKLPIIAMTAHAGEEDRLKSVNAGINEHLTKPIERRILLQVIRRHLADQLLTSEKQVEGLGQPLEADQNDVNSSVFDTLRQTINIEFLLRQFGNSEATVRTLLKRFVDSKQSEIEALFNNVHDMPKEEALSKLHNLKGMMGNLGAESLHKKSGQLEKAMKEGEFPTVLFEQWQQEIRQLIADIKSI